jgi:hypothetical protein
MSACGDAKDEVAVPKVGSSTSSIGSGCTIGKLRLQAYMKDEVHVHDDENNLVFVYKGKRAFQLGIDMFLKQQFTFKPGQKCVIKGEKKVKAGVDAADLVLTRNIGNWSMSLVKSGTLDATPDAGNNAVVADEVLGILDEFVQRI